MARKNPLKEALIYSVVAGVLAAGYTYVLKPQFEKKEKQEKEAKLLYSAERAKVLEVSIVKNGGSELLLKKDAQNEKKWTVSQNGLSFEADPAAVEGLLSSILASRDENTITNSSDLKGLNLEPPSFILKLSTGESDVKSFLVGADTPVEYQSYVKWANDPRVFTTSRSLRYAIDKTTSDLRERKVLKNLNFADYHKLTFKVLGSSENLKPLSFLFEKTDSGWKALSHKSVSVEEAELQKLFNKITESSVIGFATDEAKNRNEYALHRPLLSFAFEKQNGAEKTIWSLGVVDSKANGNSSRKFYLAEASSASVFEVNSAFLEAFKMDLMQFRKKNFKTHNIADIDQVSISDINQNGLLFAKQNGNWSVKLHNLSDDMLKPAKTELLESFLKPLEDMVILEYLDGQTPWQSGLQRPLRIVEIKSKDKTLVLFFGKKIRDGQYVMRSEGMSAPAVVGYDVERQFNLDLNYYLATPAADSAPAPISTSPANPSATPAPTDIKKGKPMKLEPTVKAKSELRKLASPIIKAGMTYWAQFTLNNGKTFKVTFAADKSPYTVSNFIHLARNGYYNGLKFHRVIADFMAQGGDPDGTGRGGPGWTFDDERNDLKHEVGVISMANAGPNTNGSQFFLVFTPQPHLNGKHTVFGKVTEGLEIMLAIQQSDVMKTVEVYEEAL